MTCTILSVKEVLFDHNLSVKSTLFSGISYSSVLTKEELGVYAPNQYIHHYHYHYQYSVFQLRHMTKQSSESHWIQLKSCSTWWHTLFALTSTCFYQQTSVFRMPPGLTGVLINKIHPLTDTNRCLKKDDVILAFDSVPIANDGTGRYHVFNMLNDWLAIFNCV